MTSATRSRRRESVEVVWERGNGDGVIVDSDEIKKERAEVVGCGCHQ